MASTTTIKSLTETIDREFGRKIQDLQRQRDEAAKQAVIEAFKELFEREPNLQSVYVTDQDTWNDEFYTLYGTGGEGWNWFAVNGQDYGDIHNQEKRESEKPDPVWGRHEWVEVPRPGHEEDFRLHGVVKDFLGDHRGSGPNIAKELFGHYRQFNVTRNGDKLEVEVVEIDR